MDNSAVELADPFASSAERAETLPETHTPSARPKFCGLSPYGNYEVGKVPRRGYHQVPLDGTIRIVRQLDIPHVEVVCLENPYGNTYFPRVIAYAIRNRDKATLDKALARRLQERESRRPRPHPDLILCIREASRAAHRERDAAASEYAAGRYACASTAKTRKDMWYALKERGIVAAHRQGLLRYVGASPQGMGVYEYGEGGKACFHSCLHPSRAERVVIADHPETLEVPARAKVRGVSLQRVRTTLEAADADMTDYERSSPPRVRQPITCYECGLEGHIARHCQERQDYDDGDHAIAQELI